MKTRASFMPAVCVGLAAAVGFALLELAFFATRNHLLPWRGEHAALGLLFFALHAAVAVAALLAARLVAGVAIRPLVGSLPVFAPLGMLSAVALLTNYRERVYSLPRDLTGTLTSLAILLACAAATIGLAVAFRGPVTRAVKGGVVLALGIVAFGAFRLIGAEPIFERETVPPRPITDTLVAVDTGQRVLILGIDGVAWSILDPLIQAGRAPTFAALAARGRTFRLETIRPTFSPVIWTSVSTGKDRFQHRIHDVVQTTLPGGTRLHRSIERTAFWTKTTGVPFRALAKRHRLRLAPYRSEHIHATSVFEAATEAGLSATQIEWYVSWPAPPLSGVSISDRFHLQKPGEPIPGAVAPAALAPALADHVLRPEDIPLARVLEFVDIEGLDEGAAKRWAHDHEAFVEEMRLNLARDLTTHNVTVDLLARDRDWRLFASYFRAVDLTHHFTWPLRDAEGDPTERPELRLRTAIRRYYEFMDRLVGEILAEVPDDVTVVMLSDHGYEDRFAHSRAPDGFAILAGPGISPATERGAIGIYDVAPTVALLLGLPVAEDQVARPRLDLLDPAFVAAHPVRTVPTWDRERDVSAQTPLADESVEQAEIERLRALGYIQ